MSRPKRSINKIPIIEDSDSEGEGSPEKKLKLSSEENNVTSKNIAKDENDSSSSESDIENYLQPIDKLDFSSSFFNLQKSKEKEFDKIEKNIFDGVSRLSDSESEQEIDENASKNNTVAPKLNFQQLEDFTRKLEEAKLEVEKYNAKKKIVEKKLDITNLLAAGESKQLSLENIREEDLHSSDFETTDEEWEEVKVKDTPEEKSVVPQQSIEIRVGDMPNHVKKKKGLDLIAAMKRRLNRIRKENQIYIHKVHLLCWIAHGNFLNSVINSSDILTQSLSLLPSEKSFPADRPDLGYLEQIVQWYKKSIRLTDKSLSQELTLENSLKLQIKKKEAFNKNCFVLIFIAILRALGLQCRLVLSFQVEPLRPPNSEMHSLSTKESDKNKSKSSSSTNKSVSETSNLNKSKITKVVSKAKKKSDMNKSKVSSKTNSSSLKSTLSSIIDKKDRKDSIKTKESKPTDKQPNLNKLKASSSSGKGNTTAKKEDHKQKNTRKSTIKESCSIKEECTKIDEQNKKTNNTKNKDNSSSNKEDIKQTSKKKSIEENKPTSTRTSGRIKDNEKNLEERRVKDNINKEGIQKGPSRQTKKNKESTEQDVTKEPGSKGRKSVETSKNILSIEQKKLRSKSTTNIEEKTKKSADKNKDILIVEDIKPRKSMSAASEKSTNTKPKKDIKLKLPSVKKSESEDLLPQLDGSSILKKHKNKESTEQDVAKELASKHIVKESKSVEISKAILSKEQKKPRSKSETNIEEKTKKSTNTNRHTLTVEDMKPRRIKSGSSEESTKKKPKKAIIKIKLPKIPRIESKDMIPQLDGANDDEKPKRILKKDKVHLEKLNKMTEGKKVCKSKTHSKRITSSFNDDDSESEFSPSPLKKSPQKGINFSKLKSSASTSSFSNSFDVKSDIINLIKGRIKEQKVVDSRKLATKRKNEYNDSDSDSDYMPEPIKKKPHDSDSDIDYFVPKPKVKKRIRVKKEGEKLKVLSSDDEAKKKKKKGINIWLEVFLEAEEKWITADVVRGQVHCVNELFMRASHPVSYVVAWNNDNTLKDVTMRYCKNFNTVTRKLRTDAKWWEDSLKPFLEKSSPRSTEEDGDLSRQQLDQPLPTTISEYKNHPLYALKRHILKFEAIYPEDIIPLGYVRGEPVYPRNSIYTCKSREIWVKDARVVKAGEKPYKIVKARPKYDRLSNTMITGQLLELFGIWQTTDYDPPVAENGIVPRNAYGNVELFKPCMLPKGTVLLQLPGLNKICRKLNIDCASAITGFDFHGGWSHPVYDGFVVCSEFEDTCIAAWHLEQEEIEKKENEKIEKRVYTNWKKLIKGLLIRERLKARYDFGGETSTSTGGKGNKKPNKGPRFATKKRRAPINESDSDSD